MATRKQDDGVRGKHAICLSVRPESTGVEITMDRVTLKHGMKQGERNHHWHHDSFVTFAWVTTEEMNGNVSQERLADFGAFVLGALGTMASLKQ